MRTLQFLLLIVVFSFASPAAAQYGLSGESGFELSESGLRSLQAASRKLYEDDARQAGDTETWESAEGDSRGTVTLLGRHTYEELPCVRLRHDIEIRGVADNFQFVADRCRVASGEWKIL